MQDIELTQILAAAGAVLLVILAALNRQVRKRRLQARELPDHDPDIDEDEDEAELGPVAEPRFKPAAAHGLTVTLPQPTQSVPTDWAAHMPAGPTTQPPSDPVAASRPGMSEPATAPVAGIPGEIARFPVPPLDEIELLAARRRAVRAGTLRRRRKRRLAFPLVAMIVLVIGGGAAFMVMRDRPPEFGREFVLPPRDARAQLPAATPDGPGDPSVSDAPLQETLDGSTPAPAAADTIANGDVAYRVPNAISRMVAVGGNAQTAVVGSVVAAPITVLVANAVGDAVADVRISFRVVAGDGQVAPAEATTDTRGRASAAWAVGGRAGTNMLEAVAADYPGVSVRFIATGVPGPASAIRVVDGDAPSGTASSRRVAFRVEDVYGNPIPDARIAVQVVSGGGAVRPAELTTSPTGIAETNWTISPESDNRLAARVAGTELRIEYEPPRITARARTGIVAGGTHTCVLTAGGDYECWGGNDQGQLGTGTAERASTRFSLVATGIVHTCALDTQGGALCWGGNGNGQLGTGDRTPRSAPAQVRTTMRLTDIAAGFAHSCALSHTGAALCWGAGGDGQIGDGSTVDRLVPATVGNGRPFIALTVGWRHTCGLAPDNTAWCWGSNTAGQLGDGTPMSRTSPTRVAAGHRFSSLSAGATLTCGITTAGQTYCWGQNMGGSRPQQVGAGVRFASVVAGAGHACALTDGGEAYCWGRNNFGQLGNGAETDAIEPVRVAGGQRFASLSTSGSHTCGRTPLSQDFCWGYNVEGQLGDGTRIDQRRPVRVIAR